MFQELIDAVQAGVKPEEITINGEKFTTAQVYRVPSVSLSKVLVTATLQSVVDYLEKNIDGVGENACFVHIESPKLVSVALDLDKENRRDVRVQAQASPDVFSFGKRYEQAEFITLLQSQFVDSGERQNLQKFIGALTSDSSVHLQDDGVTQQTVAKKGITTVERIDKPNNFILAPFRTFAEIDQPESSFILRLHRQEGGVPTISLHESDNQAWKLEAINRIAEWLKKEGVKVPILA